jgi:regulation of enolase protein 1 (concanavalin A-like superfamily)
MLKKTVFLLSLSILVLGSAGPLFAADGTIPSSGSRKPTIDGVREDLWSIGKENPLTTVVTGSGIPGFSASWWALWDTKALYIFVDVTDSQIVTDNTSSWQDDSVEIYIDGGNKKLTTAGPTEFQYRIAAKPTICPAIEEYHWPATALVGVEYAVALTAKGYSVEAKFPWDTINAGIPPQIGDLVGWEVHVNNNTGTGSGRTNQIAWLTTNSDCWSNPSHYMTVALVAGSSESAASPIPEDGATDVPRDTAALSWTAGQYAATHNVYFGTTFADVNSASFSNPKGVLVSQGQAVTTYALKAPLAYGQTYYWRVDEINAPPDSSVYAGGVWSFTVEPYGYVVKPVNATASSSMTNVMGPTKTIDGSGLDSLDQHSTSATQMWLSKKGQSPIWIQYEFDQVYKLYQMWVWNSNQEVESLTGFGAKDVTIQYSTDGTTWQTLAGISQFAQAPGDPNYTHNTTVNFAGAQAKFVKVTIATNWADGAKQAGLSEVRFFQIPVKAFKASPASGTPDVTLDATLSWRPGREAAKHEVYLSSDPAAVTQGKALVKTGTAHSFDLKGLTLDYGKTYYWKVNEVNDAAATKSWEGDVWTFTTIGYAVVDDFEKYDDVCNRLFFAWVDGFGFSAATECGVAGSSGNSTGSTVGNVNAPFAEKTIVHSGRQAMPLAYDNTKSPFYSETQREWATGQNWTAGAVDTLTVSLRGDAVAFAEVSPGTIVMNGTGTDIWDATDQCRFAYKLLKGNGTIVAKVEAISNTQEWAKAGVMIRETTSSGSMHAFLAATPTATHGISYQRRIAQDTASNLNTDVADTPLPQWVKLTRNGSTFTAQYSSNGTTWTDVAVTPAVSINMANDVLIGLAVSSHATGSVCSVKFSNVSTTGGVSGSWQVAEIGATQFGGNSPEAFYVAVQDGAGKMKTVSSADLTLICTGKWEQWSIPLSQFTSAGINLTSVKKMIIGVGDRNSPKAGGAGKLYIDDIRLSRVGQ